MTMFFKPNKYEKYTKEEALFVAEFYGRSIEWAINLLERTPINGNPQEYGDYSHVITNREQNLEAFEEVKKNAPKEEELEKARRAKYKPIVIKSKEESI